MRRFLLPEKADLDKVTAECKDEEAAAGAEEAQDCATPPSSSTGAGLRIPQAPKPDPLRHSTAPPSSRKPSPADAQSRRWGPRTARYEPRQFLIYVTLAGATGFDFGKHRVELTSILPVTMEELEGERSSGEWSTSFRLAGRARGALLNVSFGYSIGNGDGFKFKRCGSVKGVSFSGGERVMLREVIKQELDVGGLKSGSEGSGTKCCTLMEPVKENEEEDPEFTVIEQGVEIEAGDRADELKLENVEVERGSEGISLLIDELHQESEKETFLPKDLDMEKINFPILELEGLESPKFEKICTGDVRSVNCEDILENVEPERENEGDNAVDQEPKKENFPLRDLLRKDLYLKDNSLPILELEGFESPRVEFEKIRSKNVLELIGLESPIIEFEQIKSKDFDSEGWGSPNFDFEHIKSNFKAKGIRSKSLSMDDESVANEFLSMLGLETSSASDPESPREQLWKQFQKENLNADDIIFGPEIHGDISEFDMEQEKECLMMNGKSRAKMLEDAETEALMREWGLNEKVFASSQPVSNAFGSPIHLPLEEPLNPPPLDENLGPYLQTKDGGFLRSMNPSLFKGSKNSGSLVMQASRPVVMPAEMGSDIMEILQGLASVGIEKLSMQASKLMPLEDITGKTIQHVAREAAPCLESCGRTDLLPHLNFEVESLAAQKASDRTRKHKVSKGGSSRNGDFESEYVLLKDLAPLAMDKIEALSIEGLRIQSGMSDEEAPSNISPQSIGEISTLEGRGLKNSMTLGLEGAAGLQLLDVKDNGGDVDGVMSLSITLDEWMRLDSGDVDEEDEISERTTRVLAAHHAKSTEFLRADKRGGKNSGKRCGLLGNNFTVALMVQLRDPLRDYEPVGTPMLALIQVERVFIPPKPKIYSTVSERGNSELDDEVDIKHELVTKEEKKVQEDAIPKFKITEVHVAGLMTESLKKKLWGNAVQQQSGSRWLLANGMGKNKKHPFMKSNLVTKPSQVTTKVQPGDTLWSISSRIHGTGEKWKEIAALNPHIRNPNVIFPNETIRLHGITTS
ncbi:uncharacterized protein A4U43_C01F22840 [Asparagus officinalis]|uniref:LysM domain-containing protein n=1 Tax=Asparagus officinalis TaxID=4686 RepID=A0A5P1FRE4_ASPOF|nr:uncharacterized protein A4U43_C01F22840 [Asparagus officinalis]